MDYWVITVGRVQMEEVGHQGCAWGGYILPLASTALSLFLVACPELLFSAMPFFQDVLPHLGPEQWSQLTTD